MHFKALDNAAVGNTIISIEDIAIACEDTNVPYFTNNNVVGDSVTIEIKVEAGGSTLEACFRKI